MEDMEEPVENNVANEDEDREQEHEEQHDFRVRVKLFFARPRNFRHFRFDGNEKIGERRVVDRSERNPRSQNRDDNRKNVGGRTERLISVEGESAKQENKRQADERASTRDSTLRTLVQVRRDKPFKKIHSIPLRVLF